MKIVTAAEMREIDRATSEKFGVPSLTLMENAGDAVARFILKPNSGRNQCIVVVCGKGNNGGDGFVAARKLREGGKEVSVILLARADEVKGDAKQNLERLGSEPISVTAVNELEAQRGFFDRVDVIVDAIFGTGFHPPTPPLAARAIQMINASQARVVSVDLPSGSDADSFTTDQPGVCRSDGIVSFTAPKPALIFGVLTRGPIVVYSIGSPPESIESKLGLEWNAPPEILRQKRPLNSHKGLYGHALVIGGALGKSGAPAMASTAALRIGAGLVTCAVPKSVLPIVAGYTPELMTEPLDENTEGRLAEAALEEPSLSQLLQQKNVVAIGPGLGTHADSVRSVRSFVARCPLPLVIDADGLNAFAGQSKLLDGSKRPLVLTPHPGEMARLVGKKVSEIENNRIEVARSFAQEHQLVLVLKGWRTLIADPSGTVWVNTTGNPGLAKGGSGDVLTGIIAGLIAQFPNKIIDAVRAGVYLHGLSADIAVHSQTTQTMLATHLFTTFSTAIRIVTVPIVQQLFGTSGDSTLIQRGIESQ